MLYVRLMNSFEAVSLDQLNDTPKPGLHIRRKRFEFIPNAIIEQLYNPSHPFTLSHFCNVGARAPLCAPIGTWSFTYAKLPAAQSD